MLNDQSGLYADLGGPGSVVAARMAVEDFGGNVLGKPVEIVVADHQNKADIGAAIARRWFDAEKVDMAIGFDNSSVALAVERLAAEHDRIAIAGAVGSTAFTGKACTPTEASWLYDSYALTTSLARSVVAEGRDTWFFVTVDYAFGHSLEADATAAVLAARACKGAGGWLSVGTTVLLPPGEQREVVRSVRQREQAGPELVDQQGHDRRPDHEGRRAQRRAVRLEVIASGAGIRRSRAMAKMPRDADTAQPMATASMSNSTTSSSSRSIQVPP